MTTQNVQLEPPFTLDNLTLGAAKKLMADIQAATGQLPVPPVPPRPPSAYALGECYLFRTVTYAVVGVLREIHPDGLVLTDAAWIASTGRYTQAVASGDFDEVEPYPAQARVVVNAAAVVDAAPVPFRTWVQK